MANNKTGVYICTGCEIGNNVNMEKVTEYIDEECSPAVMKQNPVLCSKEGAAQVQQDIDSEGLNTICIAACSPRVKWDVFNFGPNVLVSRANIRELGVWSFRDPELGEPEDEDLADPLTMLVRDYIRMGVVQAEKCAYPESEIVEPSNTIMVMGGGVTGLNAALNCARTGYDVVLVEKQDKLGGFAANMYKQIPSKHPFTQAQTPEIGDLIQEVESNDKIKVLTKSQVQSIQGAPGQYTATVKTGDEEQELSIGSVILATGWKPYDASKLDHLGYGKIKNVVTGMELETMAKEGKMQRPSDGQPIQSAAFILCAGQRDPEHLPYCSSVCCMTSLKQAQYIREQGDEAKAYVFYKDMRTPGLYENYYREAQDDPGVFLTKSQVQDVREESDGKVVVQVTDTLLGEDLEVAVDVVVLATGMVPTTADDPVLNLQYRQGEGFPDIELMSGYADSNYICFPYETRRTGIYAAGCVRQSMSIATAKDDAAGAALKSIQCLESVNRGVSVHPRSGDPTYPKFNMVRCTQCRRCTEECPFGALDEDEEGTPKPNPTRCRRCGTCMGCCPERVISFDNYSVGMLNDMIGSIQVPEDEEEGGYRVLVFVCENDAYPALDMAAMRQNKWASAARFVPVRCLGSINTQWVAEAMSKGIDGVLFLGCKYGDDYQCHFAKGSELCNTRVDNIGETLERLQIESERVQQKQISIDEYDQLPKMIDDFLEEIEGYGPNPYKGF